MTSVVYRVNKIRERIVQCRNLQDAYLHWNEFSVVFHTAEDHESWLFDDHVDSFKIIYYKSTIRKNAVEWSWNDESPKNDWKSNIAQVKIDPFEEDQESDVYSMEIEKSIVTFISHSLFFFWSLEFFSYSLCVYEHMCFLIVAAVSYMKNVKKWQISTSKNSDRLRL